MKNTFAFLTIIVFFTISSSVFCQNQSSLMFEKTKAAAIKASGNVVENIKTKNRISKNDDTIALDAAKSVGVIFSKKLAAHIKVDEDTSINNVSKKLGSELGKIMYNALVDKKEIETDI